MASLMIYNGTNYHFPCKVLPGKAAFLSNRATDRLKAERLESIEIEDVDDEPPLAFLA